MPIFFSRALKVASLRFTAEKSSSAEVVLTVISSATTNLGGQVRAEPESTAQLDSVDTIPLDGNLKRTMEDSKSCQQRAAAHAKPARLLWADSA